MYYSYVEIEYVATSFSPARTDLAVKLLSKDLFLFEAYLASRTRLFKTETAFVAALCISIRVNLI